MSPAYNIRPRANLAETNLIIIHQMEAKITQETG